MQGFERLVRAVSLVGQIGFSLITPPLVLIWLAHLAQTRLGWGAWVMIAAIIVGMATGVSSVWRIIQSAVKGGEKKPPKGKSFNDHI